MPWRVAEQVGIRLKGRRTRSALPSQTVSGKKMLEAPAEIAGSQPPVRGDLRYFFFAGPKSGCQAASLRLGAAAITLAFSFFGFLASRLPRCSPFAMQVSS